MVCTKPGWFVHRFRNSDSHDQNRRGWFLGTENVARIGRCGTSLRRKEQGAGLPAVPSSRGAELGEKDRGCPSGHHALCLGQVKSSNPKENLVFLDVDVNGTIDRSITAEIETEPIFGVRAELQPSSKDRSPVLGHFDLFCT